MSSQNTKKNLKKIKKIKTTYFYKQKIGFN